MSVLVVARRWSFRGVFLAALVACGGNSTRREDLAAPGSGGASGSGTGTGGYCGPGGCIMGGATDPIEPPGPVLCAGVECGEGQACCLTNGECFDPERDAELCPEPPPDDDRFARKPCTSNAQCAEREFCRLENNLCQGSGHCHPVDACGECAGDDCVVCGCDGNTYPNRQTACRARSNAVVVAGGGCGDTVVEGVAGGTSHPRTLVPCAVSEQCPADELCCPITGFCYPEADPARCRMPPQGTDFPCTAHDQCPSFQYCAGEGCDAPGGCVNLGPEDECGVTLEPVCGCDGVTYTSAACASHSGVRVAFEGTCTP